MKKIFLILGIILVVSFGYYTISPLFRKSTLKEASPTPSIQIIKHPITPTSLHDASGTVHILSSNKTKYLRYEDFSTINGPDLYVYLATDIQATDFIDLGLLKATQGNFHYEIPEGTDLTKYHYALVWCKAFGVLFNYADLR